MQLKLINSLNSMTEDLFESSQIEITGNTALEIQGSKGIIEYTDMLVRVNLKGKQLNIEGKKLSISCLTGDSLMVKGIIDCIRWV